MERRVKGGQDNGKIKAEIETRDGGRERGGRWRRLGGCQNVTYY